MHIKTRNVNTAFRTLVGTFADTKEGINPRDDIVHRRPSRNGDVLMIDEPVTITYTHPRERVLFNSVRDANPFFHLYEALWMLAGRNDVAPLAYYAKQMKEYSDDGKTLNGAYGYRWRKAKGYSATTYDRHDQLDIIVNHLKADPNSRRAVLQMWNVEDDLLKIGRPNPRGEIGAYRIGDKVVSSDASKDVCCNLSVMFSLRIDPLSTINGTVEREGHTLPAGAKFLDMTVTNRSNDMIWGMLGANYVHFTFLQEYVAARLGAEVGVYHHFTNNLHVYKDRKDWQPEALLGYYDSDDQTGYFPGKLWKPYPLISSPEKFEEELPAFVEQYARLEDGLMDRPLRGYKEPFLRSVAQPMLDAHFTFKSGAAGWERHIAAVAADDWRAAGEGWIRRRTEGRKGDRV